MKANQETCKNCEEPFDDSFQFCPHCGQKSDDQLTMGVLFYNTVSNYFSFDARFLKSFIPLLFKPGYLAKQFIKGKRLLYLHPAQMYLFISVVFFFVFSFTAREQSNSLNEEFKKDNNSNNLTVVDSLEAIRIDSLQRIEVREALESTRYFSGMKQKEIDSIVSLENLPKKNNISLDFNEAEIDSLIKANAPDAEIYRSMGLKDDAGWFMRKLSAQGLKFYKARDGGNILKAFYDTIPIALFFVLPIFAFMLKLLYFKRGKYVHHLIFSFYYFSFVFTVLAIVFGFDLFANVPSWIYLITTLACFIYLFIGLKRFYNQSWFLSFIKIWVVTLVFIPILSIVATIILLFAFMFY